MSVAGRTLVAPEVICRFSWRMRLIDARREDPGALARQVLRA